MDAAASLRPVFECLYVGDLDLDLAGPPVEISFGVFPKHPLLAGFICRLRGAMLLEVCEDTDRIYNPQRKREIIILKFFVIQQVVKGAVRERKRLMKLEENLLKTYWV